jgi:hypothetical protein
LIFRLIDVFILRVSSDLIRYSSGLNHSKGEDSPAPVEVVRLEELEYHDSDYKLVITVRTQKLIAGS